MSVSTSRISYRVIHSHHFFVNRGGSSRRVDGADGLSRSLSRRSELSDGEVGVGEIRVTQSETEFVSVIPGG